VAILANTRVNWRLSPRIITIDSAYTDITVTDLHETLLDLEDDIEGMLWPHLRNTSGGEALGGGVTVGITVELQDAQVEFEARVNPLESGTATSASSPGADGFMTLTDTAATFQTNLVARGDLIVNVTDGSQASVVEVQSETVLKLVNLTGGTDNDFDISDVYDVYDVVQCRVSGGNLVAVDSVGSEISPVFPSFGTQVLTTSSSSATALSQQTLEQALFIEGVVVDTVNGYAGTGSIDNNPIGSRQAPSNNITDAKSIADTRGVPKFRLASSLTLSGVDLSDGYGFAGDSPFYILTADPSANVSNCSMENLTLVGELDGLNLVQNCSINAVTSLSGFIDKSALNSTVSLSGTTSMFSCYSNVPGSGYPVVTTGSNSLVLRDYGGSIGLSGVTGGDHSVGIAGGRLLLDNTCTGGTVHARREPFDIVDNSAGTTLLDETGGIKQREIHKLKGLDASNAVTRTPTSTTVDDITIEHTGDPATSITSTRI
jgi:hypothetical protein